MGESSRSSATFFSLLAGVSGALLLYYQLQVQLNPVNIGFLMWSRSLFSFRPSKVALPLLSGKVLIRIYYNSPRQVIQNTWDYHHHYQRGDTIFSQHSSVSTPVHSYTSNPHLQQRKSAQNSSWSLPELQWPWLAHIHSQLLGLEEPRCGTLLYTNLAISASWQPPAEQLRGPKMNEKYSVECFRSCKIFYLRYKYTHTREICRLETLQEAEPLSRVSDCCLHSCLSSAPCTAFGAISVYNMRDAIRTMCNLHCSLALNIWINK